MTDMLLDRRIFEALLGPSKRLRSLRQFRTRTAAERKDGQEDFILMIHPSGTWTLLQNERKNMAFELP